MTHGWMDDDKTNRMTKWSNSDMRIGTRARIGWYAGNRKASRGWTRWSVVRHNLGRISAVAMEVMEERWRDKHTENTTRQSMSSDVEKD